MKKAALIIFLITIPLLKSSAQYYDSLQVSIASDGGKGYRLPVKLCEHVIVLENNFQWESNTYTITINNHLRVTNVELLSNDLEDAGNQDNLLQEIKKLCFELKQNKSFQESEITFQLDIENIRNQIWTITDEMPEFIHQDYASFLDYISKNIDPKITNSVPVEGRVYVEFIVNYDGKTKDIHVTRTLHPRLDMEAISIIQSSPPWKPGKLRGNPTNVRVMYPVSFKK